MQERGFSWQRALQSAIHETDTVESKIALARMAILERFVSPASIDPEEEDALFEALDALRALDWERRSATALPKQDLASSTVR